MSSITLKIYNFPSIFVSVDVREFLHLFGLETIRLIKRRNRNGAIVSVATESEARLVIARLHQLLIKGHRLKVEYSNSTETVHDAKPFVSNAPGEDTQRKVINILQDRCLSLNREGFPPTHLSYRYPKCSPEILHNISKELASSRAFYYQTLHLMNKMNLEPPFDIHKDVNATKVVSDEKISPSNSTSTEESELESDTELGDRKKRKPLQIPQQRTMKVVNYNLTIPPSQTDGTEMVKKSKLEIHISGASLKMCATQDPSLYSGSQMSDESQGNAIETLDDILRNQVPDDQRKCLNVFQNYNAGEPSNKLYIKNLAKQVTEQDLIKLYGIFFPESSIKTIDVRLMKTGRMKGQAFITVVPIDEDSASTNNILNKCFAQAISATNGYILKDKPMVVCYAKRTGMNNI